MRPDDNDKSVNYGETSFTRGGGTYPQTPNGTAQTKVFWARIRADYRPEDAAKIKDRQTTAHEVGHGIHVCHHNDTNYDGVIEDDGQCDDYSQVEHVAPSTIGRHDSVMDVLDVVASELPSWYNGGDARQIRLHP